MRVRDGETRRRGDTESFELLLQHGVNKRRDAGTRGKLRITNYELRITNYELRITNYELRITNYEFISDK